MIGWIIKISLLVAFCSMFPTKYQVTVFFLTIAGWLLVKVRDFLDSD